MAKDDVRGERTPQIPLSALDNPRVRLLGDICEAMVTSLREQVASAGEADPLVIELTTQGGDAETGRLLAQEVRELRRRRAGRVIFLGKTSVYSAGVTMMAAFPVADRCLTTDTTLLIHTRRLTRQMNLDGSLETCALQVRSVLAQIEAGTAQEDAGFRELIEGSDVGMEELRRRAETNWYLTAKQALQRRLVAVVV